MRRALWRAWKLPGAWVGGEDADGWRESAVEGAEEVGGRDGGGEREGGDLGEGVDAGVGAAGALGEDGFAGDVVEGLGEGALDGGEAGLDLPAVEGRAVVGEDEFPVLHGFLQSITLGTPGGKRVAGGRWAMLQSSDVDCRMGTPGLRHGMDRFAVKATACLGMVSLETDGLPCARRALKGTCTRSICV